MTDTPDWAADAPVLVADVQIDPEDDPVGAGMGKLQPADGDDSELPDSPPEPPTNPGDVPQPVPVPDPSAGI